MVTSNVKQLMEARGVTIKQMARDTGLAEMTVIRARRGQIASCRLETLLVISSYLCCEIGDLFVLPRDQAVSQAFSCSPR